MISRRELLKLTLKTSLLSNLPSYLSAFSSSFFDIAHIIYPGGNWNPRDGALIQLLWEVKKRTNIKVRLKPVQFSLESKELFLHPFLYLSGDRKFPPLSALAIKRLRLFLQEGGFLLIDLVHGPFSDGFRKSIQREIQRLFPQKELKKLPSSHAIYRSFYQITPPLKIKGPPYLEAIFQNKRCMLIYSQHDLQGAWINNKSKELQEIALCLSINIVVYSLCLDYKDEIKDLDKLR
jgi:hypothetical protein